jgi:NAD(P)-dependent dehydrogenase (short-subunit alcohol dehydrogenase family)
VAVVTGAGRGIGRAYAELLAARGASVVVNDLGSSIGGSGSDSGPASDVATAIGGMASAHDISVAEEAQAVVDLAVERFGRIDIVINNAGIVRWAGFPDVDHENLARHLDVHTVGSFHMMQAAWPYMASAGYGRIVNTTSSGVFGLPNNTSYATAKGAVIGLTRSAALAGAAVGIKVNLIAPAAVTRMAGGQGAPEMTSDEVAPMVAYLAHESCPVSGEIYTAGAGRFARIFLASTPGWVHDGPGATIEDVASHWSSINSESGYTVPGDVMEWSASFLDHL